MLEGIFGRDALTEEQMESALFGIDDEIRVQVAMVSSSSTLRSSMQHPSTSGYFYGYVFGIGAKVGESACEIPRGHGRRPDPD